MTCTPIKKVRTNTIIVLTMFLVFASAFALVKFFFLPEVIWQGVFFVLAVILCELAVKYFLPIYTYSVDDTSFVINKNLGKRNTTVCNIDLDRIVALYTRDEYKKQEQYLPRSIYNYNGNVVTDSCRVLIFRYSDCTEAVVFEPNDKMSALILDLIRNR